MIKRITYWSYLLKLLAIAYLKGCINWKIWIKKTILFVSFITACYPHVSAIAFATPENVLLLALAVLGS